MHVWSEDEVLKIRRLDDASAFAYLIETYPSSDKRAVVAALYYMRRRPWRKPFHRQLATTYAASIHRDTFRFAIEAFLTFMKPEALSAVLWHATDGNPIDRDFAKYYFIGEFGKRFGRDHAVLARWRDDQADQPRRVPANTR